MSHAYPDSPRSSKPPLSDKIATRHASPLASAARPGPFARLPALPSPGPHRPWPVQSHRFFLPLSLPTPNSFRNNFPADSSTFRLAGLEITVGSVTRCRRLTCPCLDSSLQCASVPGRSRMWQDGDQSCATLSATKGICCVGKFREPSLLQICSLGGRGPGLSPATRPVCDNVMSFGEIREPRKHWQRPPATDLDEPMTLSL